MKAIVLIPEDGMEIEINDISFTMIKKVKSKPSENNPLITLNYPIGVPMSLITAGMPEKLKDKLIETIQDYDFEHLVD